MIRHIVLLSPKPETTEDQLAAALSHARELREQIPGILHVEAGENLSSGHRGYTHGFVMNFVDEEHFKQYADHPAHQPVSQELQSLCQAIIDFDLAAESD